MPFCAYCNKPYSKPLAHLHNGSCPFDSALSHTAVKHNYSSFHENFIFDDLPKHIPKKKPKLSPTKKYLTNVAKRQQEQTFKKKETISLPVKKQTNNSYRNTTYEQSDSSSIDSDSEFSFIAHNNNNNDDVIIFFYCFSIIFFMFA